MQQLDKSNLSHELYTNTNFKKCWFNTCNCAANININNDESHEQQKCWCFYKC